jgi:hypothetical protein
VRDGRLRLVSAAAVIGAALAVGVGLTSSSAGAANGKHLTIYSVASAVQFLNHADDRARGANDNPFATDTSKLRPKGTGGGDGPFAGDVAVYIFDLYAGANLEKRAGSASYTCYFNYAKHALCMAYYDLTSRGGTLIASGPVDFNRSGFRLVITGGTKGYLGARGEVASFPAPKNAQRLNLLLLA